MFGFSCGIECRLRLRRSPQCVCGHRSEGEIVDTNRNSKIVFDVDNLPFYSLLGLPMPHGRCYSCSLAERKTVGKAS